MAVVLSILVLLAMACCWISMAQNAGQAEQKYVKREVMVPMRDGISLYTQVYEPKLCSEPRPVIMIRSPYSVGPYQSTKFNRDLNRLLLKEYVEHDYIIVLQNVRGVFLSEGKYENIRPVNANENNRSSSGNTKVDDATDTYDTAEWIIRNLKTNGNIGVKGISYPGFYATVAGLAGHPAIKAISPQAPVTDWFIGDDVYRNGAMTGGIFPFGSSFFRDKHNPTTKSFPQVYEIEGSVYDYFKKNPALNDLFKAFGDSLEFFNDIKAHPVYDEFWTARNPMQHADKVTAAALVVGGWYDAEDCYGAFETYRHLKAHSKGETYLAAGPWNHGGWKNAGNQNLGELWYGAGSPEYFISNIEFPFFAHYLEGTPLDLSTVVVLPSGETEQSVMEGKGTDNDWLRLDSWPANNATVNLSLTADGKISVSTVLSGKEADSVSECAGSLNLATNAEEDYPDQPQAHATEDAEMICAGQILSLNPVANSETTRPDQPQAHATEDAEMTCTGHYMSSKSMQVGKSTPCATITYTSDPADPIPFMSEPVEGWPKEYMTQEQSYLDGRKDLARFTSEPLDRPLYVEGRPEANISVSITTDDADLIVKLIDVRPDGKKILIRFETLPLRYRHGFATPEPMVPGRPEMIDIVMNDLAHTFLPGHRIEVIIQSTNLPATVLNPQKFFADPFDARRGDFQKTDVTIWCTGANPSSVTLPIVEK